MRVKSEANQDHIKKELRKLFRSIDFVSKKFLADGPKAGFTLQVPVKSLDLPTIFNVS